MPRVGSKKVRSGCNRCKTRKVKCDEQRPSCGWCSSHDLVCEYTGLPVNNKRVRPTQGSPSNTPESPNKKNETPQTSLPVDETVRRHRLELGLLQYYIFVIAPLFPYTDKEHGYEVHANLIPQEGLRCPCLLNAMYSYALLHMHIERTIHGKLPRNHTYFTELGLSFPPRRAAHDPGLSPQLTNSTDTLMLHRRYLDTAIQQQRIAVGSLNKDNADGVCCSCILIAMIALVHASQVELHDPTLSAEGYSVPVEWFYLQRSFTPCLEAAQPILALDSATNALINTNPIVEFYDVGPPKPGPFYRLLEWQPGKGSEHTTDEEKDSYARAVSYVQTTYVRIQENEPWQGRARRIFAFPTIIQSEFVSMLEERRPRALVILAHILAQCKTLARDWWIFNSVADHHVRGIATHVPVEWQWAMDWPLRVLDKGMNTPI